MTTALVWIVGSLGYLAVGVISTALWVYFYGDDNATTHSHSYPKYFKHDHEGMDRAKLARHRCENHWQWLLLGLLWPIPVPIAAVVAPIVSLVFVLQKGPMWILEKVFRVGSGSDAVQVQNQ